MNSNTPVRSLRKRKSSEIPTLPNSAEKTSNKRRRSSLTAVEQEDVASPRTTPSRRSKRVDNQTVSDKGSEEDGDSDDVSVASLLSSASSASTSSKNSAKSASVASTTNIRRTIQDDNRLVVKPTSAVARRRRSEAASLEDRLLADETDAALAVRRKSVSSASKDKAAASLLSPRQTRSRQSLTTAPVFIADSSAVVPETIVAVPPLPTSHTTVDNVSNHHEGTTETLVSSKEGQDLPSFGIVGGFSSPLLPYVFLASLLAVLVAKFLLLGEQSVLDVFYTPKQYLFAPLQHNQQWQGMHIGEKSALSPKKKLQEVVTASLSDETLQQLNDSLKQLNIGIHSLRSDIEQVHRNVEMVDAFDVAERQVQVEVNVSSLYRNATVLEMQMSWLEEFNQNLSAWEEEIQSATEGLEDNLAVDLQRLDAAEISTASSSESSADASSTLLEEVRKLQEISTPTMEEDLTTATTTLTEIDENLGTIAREAEQLLSGQDAFVQKLEEVLTDVNNKSLLLKGATQEIAITDEWKATNTPIDSTERVVDLLEKEFSALSASTLEVEEAIFAQQEQEGESDVHLEVSELDTFKSSKSESKSLDEQVQAIKNIFRQEFEKAKFAFEEFLQLPDDEIIDEVFQEDFASNIEYFGEDFAVSPRGGRVLSHLRKHVATGDALTSPCFHPEAHIDAAAEVENHWWNKVRKTIGSVVDKLPSRDKCRSSSKFVNSFLPLQHGNCYVMEGSQGIVTLSAFVPIKIKAVGISHYVSTNKEQEMAEGCAMKDFELVAFDRDPSKQQPFGEELQSFSVGSFTFDFEDSSHSQKSVLQTGGAEFSKLFPINEERHIQAIQLRINNNQGNQHFTCLYRVKLFGELV